VSSTGEPVLSTADELVSGASIGKVVRVRFCRSVEETPRKCHIIYEINIILLC